MRRFKTAGQEAPPLPQGSVDRTVPPLPETSVPRGIAYTGSASGGAMARTPSSMLAATDDEDVVSGGSSANDTQEADESDEAVSEPVSMLSAFTRRISSAGDKNVFSVPTISEPVRQLSAFVRTISRARSPPPSNEPSHVVRTSSDSLKSLRDKLPGLLKEITFSEQLLEKYTEGNEAVALNGMLAMQIKQLQDAVNAVAELTASVRSGL
jgi:hypothetical protein